MGNLFSGFNQEQEARIQHLEKAIDADGDGIVTKAELENYLNIHDSELAMLKSDRAKLQNQILKMEAEHEKALEACEKEAVKWHNAYNSLREKYIQLEMDNTVDKPSLICNEAVDEFVDQLLADPNINIYLLPDSIERQMYANTLKILLAMFQKIFNNSGIDLIGHQLKMSLQPNLESKITFTKSEQNSI